MGGAESQHVQRPSVAHVLGYGSGLNGVPRIHVPLGPPNVTSFGKHFHRCTIKMKSRWTGQALSMPVVLAESRGHERTEQTWGCSSRKDPS